MKFSVEEATFRFNKFFALFGRGIEETRIYFAAPIINHKQRAWKSKHVRFFVFQTDVEGEHERIFYAFGHVRMSCTMIKHKSANELGL